MKFTLKAIAAMSDNHVIGKNNTLPWNIPEELQWFKKMTLDHAILMGRKTFQSIGKPLPRRQSIVLSHSLTHIPGAQVIHSLNQLNSLSISPNKTIWLIGGAEIYKLALNYCSDLYLTRVKINIPNGDAFFPDFSSFTQLEIIEDNERFKIIHYHNLTPKLLT